MPKDPYAEFQSDPYAEFQDATTMRSQLDSAAAKFKANDTAGGSGSAVNEAVRGLGDIWSGHGIDAKAAGAHRIMGAVGQATVPLQAIGALANPISALGAIGTGGLLGKGLQMGADVLGAGPGVQSVAGDAGNLAGGILGSKGISALAPKVGSLLQDWGTSQYKRVLGAQGADKVTAAKVVPQMMDEGIKGNTIGGMAEDAQTARLNAGKAVEAAWNNLPPGASLPLDPLISKIRQDAETAFRTPGGVNTSKEADTGMELTNDLVTRLEKAATVDAAGQKIIPATELRSFRQDWDRIAAHAKGFQNSLDDASKAGTYKLSGDVARGQLNNLSPELADANQAYAYRSGVSDILDKTALRQEGKQPSLIRHLVLPAIGATAGSALGPLGAAGGSAAGYGADALLSSPFYNTRSALAKKSLGGLLGQQQTPLPTWLEGLLGGTVK